MKSTGMVRKVDELGRVVLPIELRRSLGIQERDSLEIYVEDDKILLKKYIPAMTCAITGENSDQNVRLFGGKLVLTPEVAKDILKELASKVG